MNVLIVGPTHPFRGGIAHHTTLLYETLAQRHETTFVSFRRQYIAALYPGETDKDPSGAPLESAQVHYDLDVLFPYTFYRTGVFARQFDVVVLPWWVAFWAPWYALLLAGLRRHARVVFVCHNVLEHESSLLKQTLSKAILRHGDGFLVQSEAEGQRLREAVGKATPVRVAPHPTYEFFDSKQLDRSEARARLELPADAQVLLFLGFIRPYKGIDNLLDAYASIAAANSNLVLLIVGESWEGPERLREEVSRRALQRCRLELRYVANEEIEAFVKASDALVLPYVSGTGSGIAQIAFGMDTPVVATQIPAFQGTVEHGVTGLLVQPDDVPALAQAMQDILLPDTQAEMRTAIAERKGRFSWDAFVDELEALF